MKTAKQLKEGRIFLIKGDESYEYRINGQAIERSYSSSNDWHYHAIVIEYQDIGIVIGTSLCTQPLNTRIAYSRMIVLPENII